MSAIIDIIIVAIIALTVYFAIRKGFVKTVLGALGFVLSLAVALIFCGPVSDALEQGPVGDKMESVVHSAIDNAVTESNYMSIFEKNKDEDSVLKQLYTAFGAEDKYDKLSESYNQWKTEGLSQVRLKLREALTDTGVALCCNVIAFLLLFVVARILFKIAEIVLDKFVALPILKQANKLLGGVAGVVLAVFRVFLLCLVLKLMVPIAGGFGWGWLTADTLGGSVLYGTFENGNFLSKLI